MKNLFREFFLVALPKVVGGFGTIVLSMVLMRHFLEPETFGIYYLCVAAILLADAVVGCAFDLSVLRLAPVYRSTRIEDSYRIEKIAFYPE